MQFSTVLFVSIIIHLVQIATTSTSPESTPMHTGTNTKPLSYFNNLLSNETKDLKLSEMQLKLKQKLDELKTLVSNCQNVDVLQTSSKHITSAVMLLRAQENITENHCLPKRLKLAPNQNAKKQLRFFSTKKGPVV